MKDSTNSLPTKIPDHNPITKLHTIDSTRISPETSAHKKKTKLKTKEFLKTPLSMEGGSLTPNITMNLLYNPLRTSPPLDKPNHEIASLPTTDPEPPHRQI